MTGINPPCLGITFTDYLTWRMSRNGGSETDQSRIKKEFDILNVDKTEVEGYQVLNMDDMADSKRAKEHFAQFPAFDVGTAADIIPYFDTPGHGCASEGFKDTRALSPRSLAYFYYDILASLCEDKVNSFSSNQTQKFDPSQFWNSYKNGDDTNRANAEWYLAGFFWRNLEAEQYEPANFILANLVKEYDNVLANSLDPDMAFQIMHSHPFLKELRDWASSFSLEDKLSLQKTADIISWIKKIDPFSRDILTGPIYAIEARLTEAISTWLFDPSKTKFIIQLLEFARPLQMILKNKTARKAYDALLKDGGNRIDGDTYAYLKHHAMGDLKSGDVTQPIQFIGTRRGEISTKVGFIYAEERHGSAGLKEAQIISVASQGLETLNEIPTSSSANGDAKIKEKLEAFAKAGATVINLNIQSCSAELKTFIQNFLDQNKQIIIIQPAKENHSRRQNSHIAEQSRFSHPRLWRVTSATASGKPSRFSETSAEHIEFGARGQDIQSPSNNHTSIQISGTALASAQVTNAIGWVLQTCPGLKPQQVKQILSLSADKAHGWASDKELLNDIYNTYIWRQEFYTKHGVINRYAACILADLVYRTTVDGQSPEEAANEAGLKGGAKEYYLALLNKYNA